MARREQTDFPIVKQTFSNPFRMLSIYTHIISYASKIKLKTLAFSFYNFALVRGRNSPYGNATRWQKAIFFAPFSEETKLSIIGYYTVEQQRLSKRNLKVRR